MTPMNNIDRGNIEWLKAQRRETELLHESGKISLDECILRLENLKRKHVFEAKELQKSIDEDLEE